MNVLFEKLEKSGKKDSLSDPSVNGLWLLEYTTSDSILGRKGSPKVGPIYQLIDAVNLKAMNSETVLYFNFLKIPR